MAKLDTTDVHELDSQGKYIRTKKIPPRRLQQRLLATRVFGKTVDDEQTIEKYIILSDLKDLSQDST